MSSCRASLLAVLCIILYDCTHVPRAGCLSFNLSFSQPESLADLDRLIYCTGDAYLTLDTLELTRRSRRTNDSTGRATYTQPVRLWDAATGEMASFTTSFEFQITLDDASTIVTPGDGGMAFLLSHHVGSGIPPGSFGGSLGLLPNLTSGYKMMATVRYENVTKFLAVELTINGDTSYYVNATVDLKSYLPEHVAIGFSAATGGGGEQHQILSWSFISTLQEEQVHTHRYQIILGLGSALRYLHQDWEQCVVHGDIKPSNIMLDESLGTRLGDFGLARLGDHGARWHTTRAVMGTAGTSTQS
ncbi:unnamed protein product [Miscanthus lutarioriparius]|uniref:Protein kinase domain-containing protein n=1 Tax=Miscanthus lutarioriparius TaxID=422564 RepID=A0A811RG69_9POAL|nr:unnamed protein product [Miscanthus lutarioriparius]